MKAVFELLTQYHLTFIMSLGLIIVLKWHYFEKRYNKDSEEKDASSKWLLKQLLQVGISQILAISLFLVWEWYSSQDAYPDFWDFPWPYLLLTVFWGMCTLFGFLACLGPIFWTRNKILKEIESENELRLEKMRKKKPGRFFPPLFG